MLAAGFSIVRSEHEQVLGMSSFAFGMILIAAGVVAYVVNHAVEAARMDSGCSRSRSPQPRQNLGHGFARMNTDTGFS